MVNCMNLKEAQKFFENRREGADKCLCLSHTRYSVLASHRSDSDHHCHHFLQNRISKACLSTWYYIQLWNSKISSSDTRDFFSFCFISACSLLCSELLKTPEILFHHIGTYHSIVETGNMSYFLIFNCTLYHDHSNKRGCLFVLSSRRRTRSHAQRCTLRAYEQLPLV